MRDFVPHVFIVIFFSFLIAWNVMDPKSNALWRGKISWSEYMDGWPALTRPVAAPACSCSCP